MDVSDPRTLSPDELRAALAQWPTFAAQKIVVEEIAPDWTRAVVRLDLTAANANFFGTAFGGSLFSMVDPFVVILAAQQLGAAYAVWDKVVEIDFLRPGTGPVWATIEMPPETVAAMRSETADGRPHLRTFEVPLVDGDGASVAIQRRTLYVRRVARD